MSSRFSIVLLGLIFIGSCEHASVVASSDSETEEDDFTIVNPDPGTLNRIKDGRIVAQYSDSLKLKGCDHTYNLNFPIDRELAREAYNYSTHDVGNSQYGKSHVLVNGFDIYERESELFFEYDRFTTRTFYEIGIGDKGTNLPIDWMSHQSILKSDDHIYHRQSLKSHSEPQIIDDINALWKTKPNQLLKLFIPRSDTLNDSKVKVRMNGLELYGSFDMCNDCLSKLVKFRRQHQSGQESISKAIADKLKNQYTDTDENHFVIIYHTLLPYSEATYHFKYNQQDYKLGSGQECMHTKDSTKTAMFKTFRVQYEGEHLKEDLTFKDATLFQAEQVEVEKDLIYGQIYSLYGRTAKYKKPLYNEDFKFIFDGK